MKITKKCLKCNCELSMSPVELKNLTKTGIRYKKGDLKYIYSYTTSYYYTKDYKCKYIKCPICNEKIWITDVNVPFKDLEQTNNEYTGYR